MAMSDKAHWRSTELGEAKQVELRQGRLRYFEVGSGAPIVFVHGLLVNANLWRKVVAKLAPDFRCLTLDLPLGSHELPMPPLADLSAPALADLVADAVESIGLEDVTLVGNDTGGAICQLVVTRRPERVARLVLTSCDYRDNFPPRLFSYFKPMVRIPGAITVGMAPMRLRAPRRLPIAFGWLVHEQVERQAEDSYVLPALTDARVRTDLRKAVKGARTEFTNDAADHLREFDRPALVAWSADDKVFPRRDAERLASELPNARLEWIEGARTFSPEDQPVRLAELIAGFVREPARAVTADG
jgi:pimeloyl-ACP methyl ester carboxylesterase